jgi:hypothetical protein
MHSFTVEAERSERFRTRRARVGRRARRQPKDQSRWHRCDHPAPAHADVSGRPGRSLGRARRGRRPEGARARVARTSSVASGVYRNSRASSSVTRKSVVPGSRARVPQPGSGSTRPRTVQFGEVEVQSARGSGPRLMFPPSRARGGLWILSPIGAYSGAADASWSSDCSQPSPSR